MGPSLLIATCLIVAIRTAEWPARSDDKFCDQEMNEEIEFAAYIAGRVLSKPLTEVRRRSSHSARSRGTRRTMRT